MLRSANRKKNDALNLAPGFNADILYEHSSRVKSCCWQGKWFMSVDQQALRIWSRSFVDPSKIETHQIRSFPDTRTHFISAVTHASPTGAAATIILAACLDHTLKVFTDSLKLRSSIAWDAGIVTMMVYNTKNNTLITTGSAGVKLWESTANSEALAQDKTLQAADGPWLTTTGCIVPWCYGRYQTVKEKLSFQVPGLTTHIASADVAVPTAGTVSWCSMIQLITQQQLLLVMFQADVYGFDAVDGTRLHSWRSLAEQPLVDMVYITAQQQLVTASREPTVVVRQLQQDGSLAWVACLGRFAAGVHCVAAATDRPWLLTAALDGFVVAWSTDNWQQLFRMKLPYALSGIQFYKPDQFFCLAGNSVRFFRIFQAAEPWMTLTSPLVSLEPLSYGLLLATSADSSIRVLDAGSTAADKAAITTVPQLSSASLLAAAVDLPGARLFALLSSGQVHVWDLHLTKPPVLAEVWSHLSQERCCSMAFLDGTALDIDVAQTLGLSIRWPVQVEDGQEAVTVIQATATAAAAVAENHVFIGTGKGEVLVCDASRQGLVVLRVPAIKLLPVSLLLLDADLNRMVAAGGNGVRIWDLASLTCIAEVEARSQLVSGDILEGRLLLGSACGRCYMLDLTTGQPLVAAAAGQRAGPVAIAAAAAAAASAGAGSSDHDGPVTCIRGSCYLQHYVTCSHDGYVKVFDCDGFLKACVYLAAPLAAAAFLNDNGDILVAPVAAKQLMVVPAATYAVTQRTKHGEQNMTIFDELRGKATSTPRALMHNMTCRMQALATTSGKAVPISRYPAALPVASQPSSPTAATSPSSKISNSKTLHHRYQSSCLSPLKPASSTLSPTTPPWGLPSPVGLLKPECSLVQPDVIQSSTRPPVDLEQNRLRADVARTSVPGGLAVGRQSTIGRAVRQQQQQEQEQQVGQDGAGSTPAGADKAADAVTAPSGAAATNSRLSRMARESIISRAQGQLRQQQQQQDAMEHLFTPAHADQQQPGLQGTQQQQQQCRDSLPVKQLPAAFAKLSINTSDPQQADINAGHSLQEAQGLPSALDTAAAAAAGTGLLSTQKRADGSRRKQGKKLAGSSSSSSSVKWNSTFQYDLKALEALLWKRNLQKAHKQGNSGDSTAGSSESSSIDDGSSSSDDGDNSSDSSSDADEADPGALLDWGEHPTSVSHAAATAATTTINQQQQQSGTPGIPSETFTVGQLKIKAPLGGIDRKPASVQQQQQQQVEVADLGFDTGNTHSGRAGSKHSSMLKALAPAMRRTVPVVQDPDVFMEDVPVPADLQELLQRYQADMMGRKQRKKKKHTAGTKKRNVQGASSDRLQGSLADLAAQGAAAAEVAAAADAMNSVVAGSKPGSTDSISGSQNKVKKKKSTMHHKKQQPPPVYTSALDYLIHTASDPTVITELKVAELHDSKQAALAKQWKTSNTSSSSPTKHKSKDEASNSSPSRPQQYGGVKGGTDSAQLQQMYKMLKKYQEAGSRGKAGGDGGNT